MRLSLIMAVAASVLALSPVALAQGAGNSGRFVVERITSGHGNEIWILDTASGAVRVCSTPATGSVASDGATCTPWTK
jgi:hypothetical protein